MYGLKNRSPAVDKYRVTLDADERATLERLVAVGKGAARRLTHARILLLADTAPGPERSDPDIVDALGTSVRTVERVRQRLVTEGLQAALNPRPQPTRPAKIKINECEALLPRLKNQNARIERIQSAGCGTLAIAVAPQLSAWCRSDIDLRNCSPQRHTPARRA